MLSFSTRIFISPYLRRYRIDNCLMFMNARYKTYRVCDTVVEMLSPTCSSLLFYIWVAEKCAHNHTNHWQAGNVCRIKWWMTTAPNCQYESVPGDKPRHIKICSMASIERRWNPYHVIESTALDMYALVVTVCSAREPSLSPRTVVIVVFGDVTWTNFLKTILFACIYKCLRIFVFIRAFVFHFLLPESLFPCSCVPRCVYVY